MKLVIPNIIWHGEKERIMAIAIHPTQNLLMTGGSDSRIAEKDNISEDVGVIKMWTILENSTKMVEFAGAINSGHEQTVNCLKFSPNGKNFASGSDDYKIIIWSQQVRQTFGQSEPRLQWWPFAVLTGHCKEIYDLQWSKNGEIIVSGGLDKYVIVWNVKKQKQLQTLDGHTAYVQGITIDPRLKSIVSLSQDRSARVWKVLKAQKKNLNNLQFYPQHVVRKLENAQKPEGQQSISQDQQQQSQQQAEEKKQNGIFLGETSLFTFVRRPDWSPDGSFYILPAAEFWVDNKPIMGAYGFLRQSPQVPCFFLPTKTPALVIRFCSKYYNRNQDIQQPLIDLPYKMIFAIGTIDSLLLYSTDSPIPLAIFGNLHYASITDICFRGSNLIAVSSCDGFCSFVQIEEGYFGQEVPIEQLPEYIKVLYNNDKIEEEEVSKKNEESKKQEIVTEQRVEYKETQDGKKKKVIIPKTLQLDQQIQK